MHNIIEIRNVFKSFGRHQVLQNINLNVKQGEIFGLVGLNGIGKTTLIKSMLSLSSIDRGSITIFGKDSTDIASRSKVSYLPEKFYPSGFLKGEEFLKIGLDYKKIPYDANKSQAICDLLALERGVLKTKIGRYSKGMGQKLGLISVFLSDPDLYILDEPTSGLDHRSRILLKDLFVKTRESGKTILFSSHILSDIEEICDRIAIIHDSRIVFDGPPRELCTRFQQQTLEKAFMFLLDCAE